MKVKDIVAKTTFAVLIADQEEIVCDSVGYLGNYKKYENATIKSIEPFHSRSGMYKEGILCVVKNSKGE